MESQRCDPQSSCAYPNWTSVLFSALLGLTSEVDRAYICDFMLLLPTHVIVPGLIRHPCMRCCCFTDAVSCSSTSGLREFLDLSLVLVRNMATRLLRMDRTGYQMTTKPDFILSFLLT